MPYLHPKRGHVPKADVSLSVHTYWPQAAITEGNGELAAVKRDWT